MVERDDDIAFRRQPFGKSGVDGAWTAKAGREKHHRPLARRCNGRIHDGVRIDPPKGRQHETRQQRNFGGQGAQPVDVDGVRSFRAVCCGIEHLRDYATLVVRICGHGLVARGVGPAIDVRAQRDGGYGEHGCRQDQHPRPQHHQRQHDKARLGGKLAEASCRRLGRTAQRQHAEHSDQQPGRKRLPGEAFQREL